MSPDSSSDLARLARAAYLQVIQQGMASLVTACVEGGKTLAAQSVDPQAYQQHRDLALELTRCQSAWLQALDDGMLAKQQRLNGAPRNAPVKNPELNAQDAFSLVENAVIEWDMACARLSQAIADASGWQFRDLCSRLAALQASHLPEPSSSAKNVDVVAPAALARLLADAWVDASLTLPQWKSLQVLMHEEAGQLAEQAHHEANRFLLSHGVRPEIDLRPFMRRASANGVKPNHANANGMGGTVPSGGATGVGMRPGNVLARQADPMMLKQLTHLVAQQVPGFAATAAAPTTSSAAAGLPTNAALIQAIDAHQQAMRQQSERMQGNTTNAVVLANNLQENKSALKRAAATPAEKATIEVVALLFQSLLTQDTLPAQVRLWFARLQMPVLRVAIREPDFFAVIDHPARALIDRMGSCVMGFSGESEAFESDALHTEIKRVVQVIEAYPDTGRAVFQTVLTEFEDFLRTYYKDTHQASRKGVSLAQQLEQREALAIQYTIELRKMLQNVPMNAAIRDFLFKVWADVMAQSAVQSGVGSEPTHALQGLARELIWLSSAKSSREERTEVLQRLPTLLKSLRMGMSNIGLSLSKQETHIASLNTAFAEAFSAKAESLSAKSFQDITEQLQALDEILPTMPDVTFDADMLRDLSGYESQDMDVVAQGGATPSAAMLACAAALSLGEWFVLDYRDKKEPVQLVWQGLQRHLMLFVSAKGRGVLFQVHRLAAFLEAGLMAPQEPETLTMQATRQAIAKLNADPERLLD